MQYPSTLFSLKMSLNILYIQQFKKWQTVKEDKMKIKNGNESKIQERNGLRTSQHFS